MVSELRIFIFYRILVMDTVCPSDQCEGLQDSAADGRKDLDRGFAIGSDKQGNAMRRSLRAQDIAAQTFTRQKSDGTIVEWHQEDESAVISKAEAIAVVQRTIDFWLPKVATEIQQQRNIPFAEALASAQQSFLDGFSEMMSQPFPQRWGLTLADLTFRWEDDNNAT
jgi:hypothetical protein